LEPLVGAGTNGIKLTDSLGCIRSCFPLVAGHIADYPEQTLVAATGANNSPVTTAGFYQLGDSQPSPPRTSEWIKAQIKHALSAANPENVPAYHKVAKKLRLNDVHKPYWLCLPRFQPELAVGPDILHGLIQFWRDHILKWIMHLVGKDELSSRLMVLQRVRGWHYFRMGIKHLSQWTGREDRELQHVLVTILANAPNVDKDVMHCLRAFHDFLYISQYRSHSSITLGYLNDALCVFHATKKVFIKNKAQRGKKGVIPHFCIPKLAGMHVYTRHIPEMGSSPQYSTEIVESLHRPMAKNAYQATNRKDYVVQMCRFLDRIERIQHCDEFVLWAGTELQKRLVATWFASFSPGYQQGVLQAMEDEFTIKQRSWTVVAGLILNKKPHQSWLYVPSVVQTYEIHDFGSALRRYLAEGHINVAAQSGESNPQTYSAWT
jgi:hypothetical protein